MKKIQGYLNVFVKKAVFTKDTDIFGKIDSYVIIQIGQQKQKTKTIKDGGLNVQWNQNLLFQINKLHQQKLKVTVLDEDVRRDDLIGQAFIDINNYFSNPNKNHQIQVQILFKNKVSGKVTIYINYQIYKQSIMIIKILSATFIKDMDTFGKQDPYIKLIYGKQSKKTTVKKQAGKMAQWNQQFNFKIIKQQQCLILEAWDQDLIKDDYIGKVVLNINQIQTQANIYELSIRNQKGIQQGTLVIELKIQFI